MDDLRQDKQDKLTQAEYAMIEKFEQMEPELKILPQETKELKVINRLNDAFFKFMFAKEEHKHILIAFLNSILDESKQIADVTYIDREASPRFEGGKGCRFDVRAKAKDGRIFHVEVQKGEDISFFERCLFYACDSYANQLRSGKDYSELLPVIFIGVLGYEQFECKEAYSNFMFLEKKRHSVGTNAMEFHFFELTKLKGDKSIAGERFYGWLQYMASVKWGGDAQMQQLAQSQEMIGEALTMEEYFRIDPETRFRYMQAELEKHLSIKRDALFAEKHMSKGREEGIAEGKAEEKVDIAKTMLNKGFAVEEIVELTGLSESLVLDLKEKLQN